LRLADLNITRIRKVAGLSIHFIDPQTVKYHLCVLVRKGSSILVEENHEEVESIEEVAEKLPKNVPVVLTISGRNILNKDVPKDGI
jgi:precorrin-6x reductase